MGGSSVSIRLPVRCMEVCGNWGVGRGEADVVHVTIGGSVFNYL